MQKHPFIWSVAIAAALVAACPATSFAASSEEAAPQAGPVVQVRGVVLDASGQPVIGAGVVEVGASRNGTLTGGDGSFVLTIHRGASLEISCIGYETVTVTPVEGERLSVILREDAEILDEVVVMGYGTQRKKLVTGSTVNVTGEKLAAVNAVDAFGALQSQAAGVNIVQNSGQPGESYKVTIRGMGTAGSSTPLYVIDGVPGGDIASLSPNDIESIDVLKDAASSAIYGARAANGVILVTTKKGRAGKVQVTFDAYYGWQNPNTNGVTPLNAKQYMEINDKAYDIQGASKYDWASLIPKQYAQIQAGTWNGTNWLEETTVHNAPIHNESVNIIGGGDVSRFAIGFSNFGQTGTIGYPATPQYDRNTFRMNSDYSLIKKQGRDILKFGENVTFSTINRKGLQIGGIYSNNVRSLLSLTPLLPARNEVGGWYEYKDIVADGWDFSAEVANPLAQIYYTRNNRYNKGYRLQSNFFLEFAPIKGLTFRSSAGWLYYHGESRSYVPVYELSTKTSNPLDDVSQSQNYSIRWTWENTANWVKSFGNHNFDILAGQSLEKWGYGSSVNVTNSVSLFPGSFDHAYITNANVVDPAYTSIGGSPNGQGALSSFFGRLNYNYNETYLLSVVMRADGSSNFARGHRWGYFPSVSAGWVLTNEPFMENVSRDFLSFLKLRGSWGKNGNCNISSFQYVATVAFDDPYYFDSKDNPGIGAYPDIIPNEKVEWEKSVQTDIGFDARFFRSRLGLSFDWYNKVTKDWLVRAPSLLSYGTGAPYVNGGDIQNRGYEILLSWDDAVSRDFSYGFSATFSHNKNKVTRIANSEGIIHGPSNAIAQNTAELYRIQVGYPIGYFWGFAMDGIIQNEQDLKEYLERNCGGDAANSLQGEAIQPGDVKFVDVNGNGKIDKDDTDKTMIGDPNPDYNLGLTLYLQFKGFDFSMNGYGAFGQQVAKSYRQFSDHPDDNYCTDVYTKYWTGEGTTNRYPRFTHGKHVNQSELSRVWIEDADYFKISRLSLGYDLKRAMKFLPVARFHLYVAAQNMFTFTKYSGMDPEVGFGNDTNWASGIDNGYYPSARSWQVGVNITF
ncbi:MAG: TonB-dependent receptor [Bacteroidales bacterium]|nr:TonB-dependent receptor [Bacteroidales bacterium]